MKEYELQILRLSISKHMDLILKLFKGNPNITIFVRYDDGSNGRKDLLMSTDIVKELPRFIEEFFKVKNLKEIGSDK